MFHQIQFRKKKINLKIVFFIGICIFFLISSGCVQTNTGYTIRPEAFTNPPDIYADENSMQVTLPLNGTMLVSYPWTPEDGRYWRISVTSGLFVTGDRYVPYPPDMPVAVSGTRQWMVKAIAPGDHMFMGNLQPRTTSWNQEIVQQRLNVIVVDDADMSQSTEVL